MQIVLKNVRLAFPKLWTPEAVKGGKPAYSASFLIDPVAQADQIVAIKSAIREVATQKWSQQAGDVLNALMVQDKICLHDGNKKFDAAGKPLAGYTGMMYLTARRREQDGIPGVFDANPKITLTEKDGRPFGGCYVNTSIDFWCQDDKEYGRRVNASLIGIQYFRSGDSFGSTVTSTGSEFDVCESDVPATGNADLF
jgi:hypothetical protein